MQKLAAAAPSLQQRFVKTAQSEAAARSILMKDLDNTAAGCCVALRILYGVNAYDWEPETIWITLQKHGLEVSDETKNKLQAALTLLQNPAFYWDNLVFQNTVKAFDSEEFTPDSISECLPEEMAWAVHEAAVIRGLDPGDVVIPEFDEDIQLYTAVCLKRAGMACTPVELEYADEALFRMLPKEAKAASESLKVRWRELDKSDLANQEFTETSWGVQMSLLASCYENVRIKSDVLAAELASMM